MSDAKENLIKAMAEHLTGHELNWVDGYEEGFKDGIEAGRIKYKSEWIPCSERLPEIDTSLKVCEQMSDEVLGTDNHGRIRHVYLTNCGYLEPTFCTVEEGMSVEIVAWQQLPEPYRMGGGAV